MQKSGGRLWKSAWNTAETKHGAYLTFSELVNIHLCDGPGEFVNTRQIRLGKMSRVYSRLFLSDFADKRHHLQQPSSRVRDV